MLCGIDIARGDDQCRDYGKIKHHKFKNREFRTALLVAKKLHIALAMPKDYTSTLYIARKLSNVIALNKFYPSFSSIHIIHDPCSHILQMALYM